MNILVAKGKVDRELHASNNYDAMVCETDSKGVVLTRIEA